MRRMAGSGLPACNEYELSGSCAEAVVAPRSEGLVQPGDSDDPELQLQGLVSGIRSYMAVVLIDVGCVRDVDLVVTVGHIVYAKP